MRAVDAEKVYFSYGAEEALRNVSFTVDSGEFVAVMGPNGSGKSTLMKLILGLLKPSKGKISVFGVSPSAQREKAQQYIGYMPQREGISKKIPIEVKDIVLMGLTAKKRRLDFLSREDIKIAKEALESVGMLHLWNKKFSELSGGQQQRVMFARALAVRPRLLILDEPFNGVDIPSRNKILEVINSREDLTTIMVVHNVNPIVHFIDKVLLLNKKAIAFGPPKEVLTTKNLMEAYGASIQVIECAEGYCHPILGDTHG